jgi:serine protease Do
VIEHGTSITIETDDGNTYPARLVASDPQSDIALLKVDGGPGFKSVEIADQAPCIGEWVIAVGNPFGLGGTVTAGIVSARSRDITPGSYNEFIQIDAPVNQGNSGVRPSTSAAKSSASIARSFRRQAGRSVSASPFRPKRSEPSWQT